MTSAAERYSRIQEVFEAAADLPAEQRTALLDARCNGDQSFRREVEALLEADAQTDSLDEQPFVIPPEVFNDVPEEQIAGRQFGPYEVVRELGRGGLGSVHLAVRSDGEYRKEVALKLIRRGLDTDDILRRFRNERQILAQLDHPNIARLIDGGTTDDGLPYFVMEYVNGEPIADYCAARGLGTTQRLDLFRKVCAAVTYAHQNLVIHRDLKPSNILVTTEGEPKLLDFGIAKLLTADNELMTMTAPELRAMTPDYASPEQIKGERITTSSDVYSLGVLLYELLTGEKPYRVSTRSAAEISRAIVEQEPERPSVALARASESKFKNRKPKIRSADLDNVVSMAMRKEPHRRYASVNALANDIGRYLEGRPVLAHKDTLRYRARKFVQRNKAGAAAALVVFLVLISGIVVTLFQSRRVTIQRNHAQREARKAEQISGFLENVLAFSDPSWGGSNTDSKAEATIAQALEQADRRAEQELADQPEVLAAVHFTIGWTYKSQGKLDAAERLLRSSYEIRQRILGPDHQDTAQSLVGLGELSDLRGRWKESESYLLAALPVYRRAQERGEVNRKWLATALNNLAVAQLAQNGDDAAAEGLVREAVLLSEELRGQERAPLPMFYRNLGRLRSSQRDFDGAIIYARKAIEEQRQRPAPLQMALLLASLGLHLSFKDEFVQERIHLQEALDLLAKTVDPAHPRIAEVLVEMSRNSLDQGDNETAREEATRALSIQERSLTPDHRDLIRTWYCLGLALTRLGALTEGEVYLRRSVEWAVEKLPPNRTWRLSADAGLGENLIAQRRYAEAEPLLITAEPGLRAKFGAQHGLVLRTAALLEEARKASANAQK